MQSAFNRHGSAAFASTEKLAAAGLLNNGGLHHGFTHEANPRPIGFDADTPILVIGSAGTGKLTTLLAFQTLQSETTVYNDPKGEIFAISACNPFEERYCFNPYGLHARAPWFAPTDHRFNILDFASQNSPTFFEDMLIIAMNLTSKPQSGSNSEHFWGKAVGVISALLIYGKETNPNFSLPDLYNVVGDIQGGGEVDFFNELHYPTMMKNRFSTVRQTAQELKTKREIGGAEYSGILSTITNSLKILGSPALQMSLSGPSTIAVSDFLKNDKVRKLFLMIPAEYQEACGPIVRSFVSALSIVQQCNPRGRLHICIDEAGQIARGGFEALPRLYSFGRGSRTRVSSYWQNYSQMHACLGKDDADTIVSNSQSKIILGVGSHHSAQFVSDNILGKTTHLSVSPMKHTEAAYKHADAMRQALNGDDFSKAMLEIAAQAAVMEAPETTSRDLMNNDEIRHLPGHIGLLDIQGLGIRPYPYLKWPYFKHNVAHRFLPNPFKPPIDRIFVPGRLWRQKAVPIVCEPVPSAIAHLPQYSAGQWAYPKGFCPLKRRFLHRISR